MILKETAFKLHKRLVKTLHEVFAQAADRPARFEREAELLASLNHPNIAAIDGFRASGGIQTTSKKEN